MMCKGTTVWAGCILFVFCVLTGRAQGIPSAVSPVLKVTATNAAVRLAWPLSPLPFVLETASSLSGSWTNVATTPAGAGENLAVTVPSTPSSHFFRLKAPASVPLFQYYAFYDLDVEIGFFTVIQQKASVHGNANIYLAAGTDLFPLTVVPDMTAAGTIYHQKSPANTFSYPYTNYVHQGGWRSGTAPLKLPIGTNDFHEILNPPPLGEDPSSAMGSQRLYNQADMLVLVSETNVTVKSGLFNASATAIPTNQFTNFLHTPSTNSFYDGRQLKWVRIVDVNIAGLRTWSATNTVLRNVLGRDVSSLYVLDLRPVATNVLAAVRVSQGQTLPPLGLTVATPHPLYVQGHYNQTNSTHLGTTNTTAALPAALMGDAITFLSVSWKDTNAINLNPAAANTTYNAALLGSIVPSDGTNSSGLIDNFPRFLENWNLRTNSFNGSMAALFSSRYATNPWNNGISYYTAPVRRWSFDQNFLNPAKLPPCTPLLQVPAE